MRLNLFEGKLNELIGNYRKKYDLKWSEFSEKIGVSTSVLKDWYYERRLIPEEYFYEIDEDNKFERFILERKKSKWGQIKGGLISKANNSKIKYIKFPKMNKKLAEFIGIVLGDGTLRKYSIEISGDKRYDTFYFNYIKSLVKDLFNLNISLYRDINKNTLCLVIFSVDLCKYINEKFDLPYGDKIKNESKIPKPILRNKELSFACLRGLIDTDGCVGKSKEKIRMVFSSNSGILLKQVWNIGKSCNLFTYCYENQTGTDSFEKIKNYFKCVGSSNHRHVIRFSEKLKNNNVLYVHQTLHLYNKYENITLPFVSP
jgi:hypothetical protein